MKEVICPVIASFTVLRCFVPRKRRKSSCLISRNAKGGRKNKHCVRFTFLTFITHFLILSFSLIYSPLFPCFSLDQHGVKLQTSSRFSESNWYRRQTRIRRTGAIPQTQWFPTGIYSKHGIEIFKGQEWTRASLTLGTVYSRGNGNEICRSREIQLDSVEDDVKIAWKSLPNVVNLEKIRALDAASWGLVTYLYALS